ncbi:MAG: 4Fe-4S binding protein [Anaerolineae bacterium]
MRILPSFSFLRPGTRAFIQEARRTPGYGFFDWLHGYVYSRWPYTYIGIAVGEHPLAKAALRIWRTWRPAPAGKEAQPVARRPIGAGTIGDAYHGKVVTLEAAIRLVSVQQEIALTDLEHVIPYPVARDIVLRHPDHIAVLECPCRASRPHPCRPLDVCLIVGEPFASFVLEHHPRRSRRITSDEAAAILAAEHERGHVHHAFFKDAMLGRFYAICNCCSCCCGAMQAHRSGIPMLNSSGYTSHVDAALCAACGTCAERCPFGAITVDGYARVNEAECMGCGVCVSSCPQDALTLVRDDRKAAPLELDALMIQAVMAAERTL